MSKIGTPTLREMLMAFKNANHNLDRLRHLEEVDILRHLSQPQHRHVIAFVDAWEQVSAIRVNSRLPVLTLFVTF